MGHGLEPTTAARKRRRTNDASVLSPRKSQSSISDPLIKSPLSPEQANFELSQQTFSNSIQDQNGNAQAHLFSQSPLSPSFSFSPWASNLPLAPGMLDTGQSHNQLDSFFSLPQAMDHQTPGGMSASGSNYTEGEKDPFMSLLEQLAENEQSHGGPSDLDFFLSGQS